MLVDITPKHRTSFVHVLIQAFIASGDKERERKREKRERDI
jgi:hypothetical protein